MSASSVLAFSHDGQYLVHASPSGIIKIWETSTDRLKQEYVPSSHLSASCCCLSWCPWTNKNSSLPKSKKARRSSKGSETHKPDLIALGTCSGSVLLYSYVKGDLHSQLVNGHTDRVTCTAWSNDGHTLYTSSADHHVVEWDVPTAALKSKWKADNGAVHSICYCGPHHLVTAGRSIKLWDLDTRKVLRTFTGHSTEVFTLLHTSQTKSIDHSYIISAALDDRLINIWHVQLSTKDKTPVASFSLPDDPVMLHISPAPTESQFNDIRLEDVNPSQSSVCIVGHRTVGSLRLVVVTKGGQVLFYESSLNGRLKESPRPSFNIYCVSSTSNDHSPVPIPIVAAASQQGQVLVGYGSLLKPTFELVKAKADGTDICLVRECAALTAAPPPQNSSVSKVKTPKRGENVTALAPGYMAPSQPLTGDAPVKNKRKASTAEMSMGERLSAISIDQRSATTATAPPRADTMAVLLTQGLQSKDIAILNNVLQNSNETVIRNTVRCLSVPTIVPLVMELSKRMHGHAQSGMILSRWMKTVLSVHTSYLMSIPGIVDVCSSMYQMMDCRVNMYSRLSKLQGRLDLLLSQISDQSNVDEGISQLQPLLIHHEESSDDDDMLEEIIHPHSESEDNWCDISDDDDDEMDVG